MFENSAIGGTVIREGHTIKPVGQLRRLLFAASALGATVSGCVSVAGASHRAVASPPPGLAAETVTFTAKTGDTIHAWFSHGAPGQGVVVLLHGVGADRSSMQDRALFLHARGFSVLAPDLRAHGESSGEHTTFGAEESFDAAAAIRFARRELPGERIGVIGVSMGGAAALLGDGPVKADAVVLESVYPTIRQAVRNRLTTWLGPLAGIGRLLTPVVIGRIGAETGVEEDELRPIARIGRLHAPLLLISGMDDPYTPLAEAESLFVQAPEPKTFWAVPGAGHEDLYNVAGAEYRRRVGKFLDAHLHASSVAARN